MFSESAIKQRRKVEIDIEILERSCSKKYTFKFYTKFFKKKKKRKEIGFSIVNGEVYDPRDTQRLE